VILSYLNFYCYFGWIEQRSSKGVKSVEIGREKGNRGKEAIGRELMFMSHGLGYSLSLKFKIFFFFLQIG
jgi:hypothetical protein